MRIGELMRRWERSRNLTWITSYVFTFCKKKRWNRRASDCIGSANIFATNNSVAKNRRRFVRLMETALATGAIISSSKFDDIIRDRVPARTTIGPLQKQNATATDQRPFPCSIIRVYPWFVLRWEITIEDPLKSKPLVGRTCSNQLRIVEKEGFTGTAKFSCEIEHLWFGRIWLIHWKSM